MASKPDLDAGALVLAHAYARLSTCRQLGAGGIGPIPIDRVWEWADRKGIRDPRVRDHIEAVISTVDAATLRRANRPKADHSGSMDKTPPKSKPKTTRRRISR